MNTMRSPHLIGYTIEIKIYCGNNYINYFYVRYINIVLNIYTVNLICINVLFPI